MKLLKRERLTRRTACFTLLAMIWTSSSIGAQVARSTFAVSLGSGAIAGTLPFDEPFVLTSTAVKELREVRLWVGPAVHLQREDCALLRPSPRDAAIGGGSRRTDVDPRREEKVAKTRLDSIKKLLDAADSARKPQVTLLTILQTRENPLDVEVARLTREINEMRPVVADKRDTLRATEKELKAVRDSIVLVRHILTVADAALYDLRRLLAAAPLLNLAVTSIWKRNGLDSLNTVALDVNRIEPNRDYTFCYQLVQDPSKDDIAKFVTKATASLTSTVRSLAAQDVQDGSELDALQLAVLSALPAADSIEFPSGSIFARAATGGETDAARLARLSRIGRFYADFKTDFEARKNNLTAAEGYANVAENALRDLVADSLALRKLAALGRDPGLSRNRVPAFAVGAAVARRLAFVFPGDAFYFSDVARGVKTLEDVGGSHAGRDLSEVWASDVLKPYDAALQRSAALADSVRDLAEFAVNEPTLLARYAGGDPKNNTDSVAAFVGGLRSIVAHVAQLLVSLEGERNMLANLASALDASNAGVQKLVASITTIDFANVALRGTTAVANQARAMTYVSLDAGLAGGERVREVVPYFGVNLYLRPVNKNMHIPFPWRGRPRYFSRRFALTLGVTAASIKQEGRIDDLFNSHAVLLGAGLRLTDYWRVTAGRLFLKSFPDGAMKPARITRVKAYGTSIDIDILGALGKITGFLIPNFK